MKKIYIILSVVLFFIVTPSVNAAMCDKTDILKKKSEANNINIEYELVKNKDGSSNVSGLFDIKITGLTENLIIKEETTQKTYFSKPNNGGTILIENVEGGNLVFKINYKKCANKLLRTIKVNLPKYNVYSLRDECENINEEELEICGKWYQGELNDEIFNEKIKEYQKEQEELRKQEENKTMFEKIIEKAIDYLLEYYIYVISAIVVIVIITLTITLRRRRASLE